MNDNSNINIVCQNNGVSYDYSHKQTSNELNAIHMNECKENT